MKDRQSLQERYAPQNICFGCGPANPRGLRIRSFSNGDGPDAEVVAEWLPQDHHRAFEGAINGGIIGTLLDCHSNWTAARHLMIRDGMDGPPCTVTSEFHVKLKRPTPPGVVLRLSARVVSSKGEWATVEAAMTADGKVTATCTGVFVAVKPGHPAYHRW